MCELYELCELCELCELRKKTEEMHRELKLQFVHLQVEMMAQREGAAAEAEKRIYELTDEIIKNLKKNASVTLDGGHDEEIPSGLLRGKLQ